MGAQFKVRTQSLSGFLDSLENLSGPIVNIIIPILIMVKVKINDSFKRMHSVEMQAVIKKKKKNPLIIKQ